jgi:UDP-N-acetylmuramoyl-tripeptide--D-alanyl-D-alanine ligase
MTIVTLVQRFLASCARRAIRREKTRIIAITGSVGKSSAKETIAAALGSHEPDSHIRASYKNYNNEFGVPFTVFNVEGPERNVLAWSKLLLRALWIGWGLGRIGANTLVLEMGADRPGDIAWLTGIAPPDISIFTAVAHAHSEFLGSPDQIANEKANILRALKPSGVAILNADDPRITTMRKETQAQAIYVGASEGSDVRIGGVQITTETDERGHVMPRGLAVALEEDGHEYGAIIQGTVGHHQGWSVAAAVAVARTLGITPELALQRLTRDYHGFAGRMRIVPGIKYTCLVDDSYTGAPVSAIAALRDIGSLSLSAGQRRIVALGDMAELGEFSEELHRSVGLEVAAQGFDALVTCGTLARGIADAAREAGMDPNAIQSFGTSGEAGLWLQSFIKSGDIVLIKGSQRARMERIVKELMAEPLQAPFLLVRQTERWLKIP